MDYPNTLGGFRAVFYVENGRQPTDQDVWDAGVRSAKQRFNADQIIVTLRARIAELERGQVPEGFVLVPKEPTGEMMRAAAELQGYPGTLEKWRAMLAASPSPADSGEVKP